MVDQNHQLLLQSSSLAFDGLPFRGRAARSAGANYCLYRMVALFCGSSSSLYAVLLNKQI